MRLPEYAERNNAPVGRGKSLGCATGGGVLAAIPEQQELHAIGRDLS